MYLVAESSQSLALRGKIVQVHEFENGTVKVMHGALELAATQFRKGGGVRQQDVADNKYLASTLERVRKVQIANDMQALAEKRMTKREKAALHASLAQRATPSELNAVAPLPGPNAPQHSPPNRHLAAGLERSKKQKLQNKATTATTRRRALAKV